MGRYRFTPPARDDLLDTRRYLRLQSVGLSDRVRKDFTAAFRKLAEAPNLGHSRPDLAPDNCKFYVVHSYLIIYATEQNDIRILRVVHAARDIEPLLNPEDET